MQSQHTSDNEQLLNQDYYRASHMPLYIIVGVVFLIGVANASWGGKG